MIASIASFAIRTYTWHYYRVRIDIQALQFSLLAGRLFVKGVHYHGQNETIIIQDGYVTWRYWLRRIEELDLAGPSTERSGHGNGLNGEETKATNTDQEAASRESTRKDLPCRVLVKARGVQWFIYNRSPAYDVILQRLSEQQAVHTGSTPATSRRASIGKDDVLASKEGAPNRVPRGSIDQEDVKMNEDFDDKEFGSTPTKQSTQNSAKTDEVQDASLPGLLGILPIQIECNKGAIVMGNPSTRSVLTATFETASGTISARGSRPADQYKQSIDINFIHPIIQFKHNGEYHRSQVEEGKKLNSKVDEVHGRRPGRYQRIRFRQRTKDLLGKFWSFVPYQRASSSVESFSHPRQKPTGHPEMTRNEAGVYGPNRWLGLNRYLDDNDEIVEQERWKAIEYAQFPAIVDSPSIFMSFHWDVPGVVQPLLNGSHDESLQYRDDVNGDMPPDWGIDLRVKGGTITYGPWADRQRTDLQAVFFPTLHMDTLPSKALAPGQTRVSTELKIIVIIEEQTTLRIPTREDSKDWKWKGRVAASRKENKHKKAKPNRKGNKAQGADSDPENRPFGWLDIDVAPDSTVNFAMDLVARSSGYKSRVILDLKGIEISSSVNHALLLRSQSQVISCDLGYPLAWNALRRWNIDIRDENAELFILRDHIFLLTDIVNDWSSGPPVDFHTFVPFIYTVALRFRNFQLYVNANDSNIIDNPAATDDNTFVVIWGQELIADLAIPMDDFRPTKNKVSFDVEARDGGFKLLTPPWNTQHKFLPSPHVASLKDLRIDGSYTYHTSTSPTLTDIVLLDVHALSLKAELYGFLIRYLMKIKDNYFGDDIHFRTVEEYQQLITKGDNAPPKSEPRSRPNNDLDVIVGITVLESQAQLPAQLYSATDGITMEISSIQADLRVTNYYMDLAVTSSPISISRASRGEYLPLGTEKESTTQISIDGVEIYGHRLFGLPPTEPTYVCNWDFDVGRIEGDCSIHFMHNLAQALSCFGLTFSDAENAVPPLNPPVIHDVTFLRAKIQPVAVGVRIEQAALLLQTREISIKFNDWAGSWFSNHVSVQVPDLNVALVNSAGAAFVEAADSGHAKTYAYLNTTVDLHSVSNKSDFEEDQQCQQNHIAVHDARTQRTPWLILSTSHLHPHQVSPAPVKTRPPAMCFPNMPAPISAKDTLATGSTSLSLATTISAQSQLGPRRNSSFLTTSSVRKSGRLQKGRSSTSRPGMRQDRTRFRSESQDASIQVSEKTRAESTSTPGARVEGILRPATSIRPRDSSHLGFAFTSPYKEPHFPVLALIPETQHVPQIPQNLPFDTIDDGFIPLDELKSQLQPGTSQSSLLINVDKGVRLFCAPRALFLATRLQEGFQAREPEALLDRLQIETMNQLRSVEAKLGKGSSVLNLRLHVPFIGLNFINEPNTELSTPSNKERYELNLENLTATVRSSDLVSEDALAKIDYQISAHVGFDRLECSAREYMAGHTSDQAVIGLSLLQPVFWMNKATALSAELHFEDLEIISASRKVDHISLLLRQTIVLVEKLANRFSRNASSQASRLALLVLLLTKEGEDIPDPPFLSGASYVLRSAVNHLRSSDSWKMMSRLRHVLQELPRQSRQSIREKCAERYVTCPPNGGTYVIKTFDHWRTWDLAHVRSSILMQKVFGDLLLSPAQRFSKRKPSKVLLRAGRARLLIDPGPHQNEFVVSRAVVNTALFQGGGGLSDDSLDMEAANATDSMVEVYFVQIALRLNWGLFELVESIMRTIQDAALQESLEHRNQGNAVAPTAQQRTNWHFVACVDMVILNVDTLALKVISLCQGLRSSFVFLDNNSAGVGGLMSIAISADAATSEIRSFTDALTLYKLQRPSVVGSKDGSGEDSIEKPWRFVGSGKEVTFEVLASLLEIAEVADSFMKNEVTVIYSWMQSMESQMSRRRSSPDMPIAQQRLPRAHVTLFLDAYFVTLMILPTLSYQIHGTGGRTSIKSSLKGDCKVDLDVDIRDHSHTFRGGIKEDAVELSALQIPPINGRLILDLTPQQRSVVLRALAEPIVFDASAIHSMITAVNRPEIVNIGKGTSDQINLIQAHAQQIFNTKMADGMEAQKVPTLSQPILYDAYVTLAGFAIHARTPDSHSEDFAAELEFNMGRITLKAANNELGRLETVKHPEIEARLDAIRLRLMRSNARRSIPCGEVAVAIVLRRTLKANELGEMVPSYQIGMTNPEINVYTESASVVVAIAGHLQDTLMTIKVSEEVKNLGKLGYARLRKEPVAPTEARPSQLDRDPISEALLSAMYSLEMTDIRIIWKVGSSIPMITGRETEDLVLSFTKINLATKRENAARLTIQNLQLQMVPQSMAPTNRSANSALLPEIVFNAAYLSTTEDRRFAFQAKGKALDLRLTTQFILPASDIRRSIALATEQVRAATQSWYASTPTTMGGKKMNPLSSKKLGSVLVDAGFAGAEVYIQGRSASDPQPVALNALRGGRLPQHGRYNQFTPNNANSNTTLRAPGFAFKAEYRNMGVAESYLHAELKVDASSNILYPTIVPLIMEISSSIKEIVGEPDNEKEAPRFRRESKLPQPRFLEDERLKNTNPVAIFGNVSLNFGLRICRQEFSLSCQPIARVAATACFDDIYMTINTVRSEQYGQFFSISAALSHLSATVQHVYSRESTGGFNVDSIVLSLMNSKHVSDTNGISAILKLSPTTVQINAKQSQDFLLFRDIWVPSEIRHSSAVPEVAPTAEPQAFIVQRYQQVAAAGAFPWNATVSIEELDVQLDFGQSLGKLVFSISHFWVSSKKSSDWEQNLCLGFDKVSVDSRGRTSGSVEMQNFKVRTSIQWPIMDDAHNQTPLIQAAIGFDLLSVKAGFDYQPFLISNITSFEFLMYNVRDTAHSARDRLVGVLDANQLQIFLTTASASQAIALHQAIQRLIQEKQTAYESSLRDIEKYLRRKSSISPFVPRPANLKLQAESNIEAPATSLKLQTDVVVTLKSVNLGAFASTFFDSQIFKVEALDASARFAVVLENERIHSTLGLILGQLRIALSGITRASVPKTLGEVSLKYVVDAATGSRGGTILKVPKLVASMQTWQSPNSTAIDYIFKSSFQGKVDVGWNYSRISYIREMYARHERALAQRLGKALPQSAVQITGLESESERPKVSGAEQEKITAVVNVPQSKYKYTALQPPIIETPQLRDMGEATPPLEWIGLHRDRLPNLTHQIVIVALLQLAAEVDDAYTRILGSS